MSKVELAGHHLRNALTHTSFKKRGPTNFLETCYPLGRTYVFFEWLFSLPDETKVDIIEGYDALCRGWPGGDKCPDCSPKEGKCTNPSNNPESIAEYNREVADFFELPIGPHAMGEIKSRLGRGR